MFVTLYSERGKNVVISFFEIKNIVLRSVPFFLLLEVYTQEVVGIQGQDSTIYFVIAYRSGRVGVQTLTVYIHTQMDTCEIVSLCVPSAQCTDEKDRWFRVTCCLPVYHLPPIIPPQCFLESHHMQVVDNTGNTGSQGIDIIRIPGLEENE